MFIIKGIAVIGLLAAGVFFLFNGLGVDIPLVKYKGVEGRDLPAGLFLLIAGLLLARFWKVSETSTSKVTSSASPGGGFKITTETKTERKGIQ